jgi:hypothetical protein
VENINKKSILNQKFLISPPENYPYMGDSTDDFDQKSCL